jgi:hypothetical protein
MSGRMTGPAAHLILLTWPVSLPQRTVAGRFTENQRILDKKTCRWDASRMDGMAVIEKPAAGLPAPGRVGRPAAPAGSAATSAEIVPPRRQPSHHRVMGTTAGPGPVPPPVAAWTPVLARPALCVPITRGVACAPALSEDKNATAAPADEDKTED